MTAASGDRPRGLLSDADRAYLTGDRTYDSPSSEREVRRRIRERVRNGIVDFALLFEHLDARDRQQLLRTYENLDAAPRGGFDHEDEWSPPAELEWDIVYPDTFSAPIFTGGMRQALGFTLLCAIEFFTEEFGGTPDDIAPYIEALVSEAVADALARRDIVADVTTDVDIDEHEVDLDEVIERFERHDVTDEEVLWLIHARAITFDEMVAYVQRSNDA